MTEVRSLFSTTAKATSYASADTQQQCGLFATTDYKEGDVILEETPIVALSQLLDTFVNQKPLVATTSSVRDVIRSQFNPSSFSDEKSTEGETDKANDKSSPLTNLVIPKEIMDKMKSSPSQSIEARTKKLRGMILAVATYAAFPLSGDDAKKQLFELYHPSLEDNQDEQKSKAVELAKFALQCCKEQAFPDSALYKLVLGTSDNHTKESEVLKLILIYSCNAFEGGRIYHKLSRVNHSCNPNAVVVEGDTSDVSILKAACDISKGSEITISYLGKELYAAYPFRQRKLMLDKHFTCRCTRCTGNNAEELTSCKAGNVSLDLASRIPCPICHPRTSRYLDEDLMFDEEEDDLHVSYALAENGMTPEERNLHCTSCAGVTSVSTEGSVRKKKEGMTIKYMTLAEEKVFEEIETSKFSEKDRASEEQDVDRSLLQMATATCGSKHWTTQMLSLTIIEETLANLQTTLMTVNPEEDKKLMEEIFCEIAECADGIEKAFTYAKSLKLNLDPAHWLFDYVLGLSRTLVGLGDEKSQKYGADWILRVDDYASRYESEGMRKVVAAIKNAWKRDHEMMAEALDDAKNNSLDNDLQGEAKRRKVG